MEAAEQRYLEVVDAFGPALSRVARAYERDPARAQDLLQEIHVAVWRSLRSFAGNCSLKTWAFRVAHNTAVTHVAKAMRTAKTVSLDELTPSKHR